jgi:hypothetical protein
MPDARRTVQRLSRDLLDAQLALAAVRATAPGALPPALWEVTDELQQAAAAFLATARRWQQAARYCRDEAAAGGRGVAHAPEELIDQRAYILRVRALAAVSERALYLSSATAWTHLHQLPVAHAYRLAFMAWLYDTGRLHDGRKGDGGTSR